jgi:hypothetical protein
MMVVHLDRLVTHQGVARDELLLKRDPRGQLQSNHRENRATGKESEADHRRHKDSLRKKKWRYAYRLFGKNNLKEGAV